MFKWGFPVKKFFALLLLCVSLPLGAASGPEQLIRDTSSKVLGELKANVSSYREDPREMCLSSAAPGLRSTSPWSPPTTIMDPSS